MLYERLKQRVRDHRRAEAELAECKRQTAVFPPLVEEHHSIDALQRSLAIDNVVAVKASLEKASRNVASRCSLAAA